MRLEGFQETRWNGRVRVQATATWESAGRDPCAVYAETPAQHARGFWPDPTAFLIAAFAPTWHAGEQRIVIDAPVCSIAMDNLEALAARLGLLFPEFGPPPTIEPVEIRNLAPVQGKSLALFSGGVDSTATLYRNHELVDPDHPAAIAAILGVDLVKEPGLTTYQTATQSARRAAAAGAVARTHGVEAIALSSNILDLDTDGWFFTYKWHGAVLGAMAHLFSRRFPPAYLASSHEPGMAGGWGSTPDTDPYLSSGHFRLTNDGHHLIRLQKLRMVAGFPHLLVCQSKGGGEYPNCGSCEKCLRTRVGLVALGMLQQSQAFQADDVDPREILELAEWGMVRSPVVAQYYKDMIPGLEEAGREDLTHAIRMMAGHVESENERSSVDLARLRDLAPHARRFALAHHKRFGTDIGGPLAGKCWGPPTTETHAVRELESWIRSGFDLVVFNSESRWWLERYPALDQRLRAQHSLLADQEGLLVFELRDPAEPQLDGGS